jgi:hypothetical protein
MEGNQKIIVARRLVPECESYGGVYCSHWLYSRFRQDAKTGKKTHSECKVSTNLK